MSESWTSTRAKIASRKSHDPKADVSDLQEKLREQVATAKIRKLAEDLSHEQRQGLARILTTPEGLNGGGHE